MTEHLSYWGLIASMVGVAVTVILTIIVVSFQQKQRKSDEEYYKNETFKNAEEITKTFLAVIRESRGRDTGSPEEDEQITSSLEDYFKQNTDRIRYLIQYSEMCLEKWVSLKPDQRNNIKEIISSLNWLIEDYFPEGKSFNTKKRTWTQQYNNLHAKREKINQVIESLPDDLR